MKTLPGFLVLLLIVCAMGCSGNDKDRATQPTGSMPSFPSTSSGAEGAGVASGDQKMETSPASSGGSSLQASTPYSSGKGAVSQNLNPSPFLTAAAGKGSVPRAASATGLVSRADGTMYGPSDLSAAGVGPGMSGGAEGGAYPASKAGKAKSNTGLSAPAKPPSNQSSGK